MPPRAAGAMGQGVRRVTRVRRTPGGLHALVGLEPDHIPGTETNLFLIQVTLKGKR